ncbi:MAG: peptide methionine sulfoxide reductase [Phycisphaerales bacterium]|nr:peptide methionine sulfoxide reductase [Phycisphaerales bacterium]
MKLRQRNLLLWSMIMFGTGPVACSRGSADYKTFPAPAEDLKISADAGPQKIVLAGGCFWCTEAVFQRVPGVTHVESGYAGGTKETADYESVCTGRTDHAEAIEITYDPAKTSLGKLMKLFFSIAHDPTTLNQQGADHGRQYRSAVFYANDDQKRVAEAYIKQLNDGHVFSSPVVTTVEPLNGHFFKAEQYHQNYANEHPNQPYIQYNANAKVEKLEKALATTQP